MRLVFMGTPHFAVPTLQALHEAGHEIAAVYTQPPRPAGRGHKDTPSPVHQYSLEHGLPVFTPASLKSPETQAQFAAHKADVAVVAAYGLLLPKPVLEAYPLGCINVHPSLLPRWRGAAPIQRAIMAGDTKTGICIMQMDEGLDTGDVLLCKPYPIEHDMTAGELQDELAKESGPLILETLQNLQNKTAIPKPQSNTGVEYAKKITKEERRIDWKQSALTIKNKIYALNPHPGAFFIFKGEAIKILEAEVLEMPKRVPHEQAGTFIDGNKSMIACGEGIITSLQVQRPGKKPMAFEEMLRGHPIPPGTALE